MIDFWPPDARLYTDGRIWRWVLINSADSGIACHRSRSLLIATLSLWRWVRRARRDRLGDATTIVFEPATPDTIEGRYLRAMLERAQAGEDIGALEAEIYATEAAK